jgi:hypothetical protein
LDKITLLPDFRISYGAYKLLETRLIESTKKAEALNFVPLMERVISSLTWIRRISQSLRNIVEAIHDLDLMEMRVPEGFWEAYAFCYIPVLSKLSAYLENNLPSGAVFDLNGGTPQYVRARSHYFLYHGVSRLLAEWEQTSPEQLAKQAMDKQSEEVMKLIFMHFLYNKDFLYYPSIASAVGAFLLYYFISRSSAELLAQALDSKQRDSRHVSWMFSSLVTHLEDDVIEIMTPLEDIRRFLDLI